MERGYNPVFDTRYIKLKLTAQLTSDCMLPVSKASAIRGGIGEMLLRMNCISDRHCESCGFESECIVQRTMYSKYAHMPELVASADSIGYVIECENYKEHFSAGDELGFNLILFGNTLVYFNLYMQAVFALGQNGLGKDHASFVIRSVTNSIGEAILDGNNIHMQYYRVETLRRYVDYRISRLSRQQRENMIVFQTPLILKSSGNLLETFEIGPVVRSLQRRLYLLGCYEDADREMIEAFYKQDIPLPEVLDRTVRRIDVRRYSFRHENAMYLDGIKGSVKLDGISEELLPILLAGEIVHVGNATSFGCGRITIK